MRDIETKHYSYFTIFSIGRTPDMNNLPDKP